MILKQDSVHAEVWLASLSGQDNRWHQPALSILPAPANTSIHSPLPRPCQQRPLSPPGWGSYPLKTTAAASAGVLSQHNRQKPHAVPLLFPSSCTSWSRDGRQGPCCRPLLWLRHGSKGRNRGGRQSRCAVHIACLQQRAAEAAMNLWEDWA